MKKIPKLLLGAVSALAIGALPVNFDSIASGSFEAAAAHAKSGNGHGGGNGKGGSSERGKSADAKGHLKSQGAGRSRSGKSFASLFGKERSGLKSANAKSGKTASNKSVRIAALPENAPLPDAKPQNFNAKLAGLNSLNRNYHAYLNSNSPRMAEISAFVRASAEGAPTGTDDEALRNALIAGANKNRLAEYGDDYVDDDMMQWARDLLGVGDDAYGKIDEVEETLEP